VLLLSSLFVLWPLSDVFTSNFNMTDFVPNVQQQNSLLNSLFQNYNTLLFSECAMSDFKHFHSMNMFISFKIR